MSTREECPWPQKLVTELWETILGFQDIYTEKWNQMKDKIKLALAQISSKRENKSENLRKIEELTLKAKEQGADLIIFPEMSLTGYVILDQVYEISRDHPWTVNRKSRGFSKKNRDAHHFWDARAKRKNPSNSL